MFKINVIGEDKEQDFISECLPCIEKGFIRIVTDGTFLDIKSCAYINKKYIQAIKVIKEGD